MDIRHAPSTPRGPGSVAEAPYLPAGFTDTFTSRYVEAGDVRLHAVVGGHGRPLLLIHGWPETWYAWRLLMPALARDFQVVAVDQRGIGLSDRPAAGYDTGTQANDLVALMRALGHERFAEVGHDTGFAIGYALAADHPDRVERVALAEIPGSPGTVPAPPLLLPGPVNDRVWHLTFNRLPSTASTCCRPPSAMPCASRWDWRPGSHPTGSSSGWPCSAWCPASPSGVPCAVSSRMRSGSMPRRDRSSGSWHDACSPSRSPCSSRCATRPTGTTSRVCLSCGSKGCRASPRVPCWRPAVAGRLDDDVGDRIVAETGGNPLALLELPGG